MIVKSHLLQHLSLFYLYNVQMYSDAGYSLKVGPVGIIKIEVDYLSLN